MNAQARTRVGIIGAGNIATIAQLPTLVKRDDVELAALVSRRPDPGPLMRRWGFRAAYRTVEDMLSAQNLDAVFVLTPRSEHAHAVEACLRRDVDVFCEKPLAPSADEAERLADLADQRGRLLMVDFNRRYAPVYVAGREAFGSAGATFCVAQKNRPGSEYRATFENAIHMVDLLRWYCGGDPVDVTAHTAGEDPWQEDGTAAIIRFDTGNTGVLMAARTAGAWNENSTPTAPDVPPKCRRQNRSRSPSTASPPSATSAPRPMDGQRRLKPSASPKPYTTSSTASQTAGHP